MAAFAIFVDVELLFIGILLTFLTFPAFEIIQHFAKRNLEELMGLCAFAFFGTVLFMEVLISAPLYSGMGPNNLSFWWLGQLIASLAFPTAAVLVGRWTEAR